MRVPKKILLPFILMFNGLLMGSNNFEYYSDGIYDAYIQLNKEIQSGLDERQMGEYAGKKLVAIDVENSSTVDIIFYKTIGNKNTLSPTVVNYSKNGRNYLVFDMFDRTANAKLLQKKLMGYGLRATVLDGGDGYEYTRNPIVIKKLVDDLKHSIRNTPVKVITIEKTRPKQLPSLNKYASKKSKTYKKKKKSGKKKQERRSESSKHTITQNFLYVKGKFCETGVAQKNLLHLDGKSFKKGAEIRGFDFVGTKETTSGTIALLLGANNLYYKLRKNDCPKGKSSQKTKVAEKPKVDKIAKAPETKKAAKVKTTKPKSQKTNENNTDYTCDFTTIRTAKNSEMKTIRIQDTTYNGKTNLLVYARMEGNQWKVRHGGADALLLSENYFNKACKK